MALHRPVLSASDGERYNGSQRGFNMESTYEGDLARAITVWTQKRILGLSRHWLALANLFWGTLSALPWLAPVLMKAGATGLAMAVYRGYSLLCHQFANRSFFLFGPKAMYAYTDLLPYVADANTYGGLRAFIGNAGLGYKVAWSDRMVSLYGGLLLGGLVFGVLRRRFKPRKPLRLLLMLVPMALDGATHVISDWSGVGQGFRYTNAWLATLTGHVFGERFYVGTELGSFNSWMRGTTGLLAGMGVVWVLYPLLDGAFRDMRQTLEGRFGAPRHG